MKKTMDANERMLKILQASPDQQALIDAILEGRKPDEQTIQGPLLMGVEKGAKFMGVSRTTLWRIITPHTITVKHTKYPEVIHHEF